MAKTETNTRSPTRSKRKGRAKQQTLLDTTHPDAKPILKLAAEYVEIRDERMELGQREIEKREELRDAIKKAGLAKDGFHIIDPELGKVDVTLETVPAEEKVKVKIKPVPAESEGE